jgi:hypothetical protein
MRVSGEVTSVTGKDTSDTPMATSMKETSSQARLMGRVCTSGPMGRYTMASGVEVSRKATVFGAVYSETLTLASGRTRRLMAMACISGKMEIDTRESGETASKTAKGQTYLPTAIRSLGLIKLANLTDTVSISGNPAPSMSENFVTALNMVKVNGKNSKMSLHAINMTANTHKIGKMASVYSCGNLEISTKATTLTTREMAMVKCFGPTAPSIKENGKLVSNTAMEK